MSYFYILLASACFGSIGVLVKLIGTDVPVMTLNFLRLFIGLLVLLVLVPRFDSHPFSISKSEARECALVGFFYVMAFCTFVLALQYITVQNTVLIHAMGPFFILLFASHFLHESMTSTKLLATFIAFMALFLINPFQAGFHLGGTLIAFSAALFYAAMVIGMRKEGREHGIRDVLWFFIFGSLYLLPFPFIYGFGNLMDVFPYVFLLGVLATGVAYFLFYLGIQHVEAGLSGLIVNIVAPLSSIFMATIFINEPINIQILLGGFLLVAAGILLEVHDLQVHKSIRTQKVPNKYLRKSL